MIKRKITILLIKLAMITTENGFTYDYLVNALGEEEVNE